MLSVGERPRVLKWFHAGPMLFGDWGTSRLYVLGLAFAFNGRASFWFILLMSMLLIGVGYSYEIICRLFPDGGGVYSSARHRSQLLAVVGGLLLCADYVVTAALSCLDAFHYLENVISMEGMQFLGFPLEAILASLTILLIGILNSLGPTGTGSIAMVIAIMTVMLTSLIGVNVIGHSIGIIPVGGVQSVHFANPFSGGIWHSWVGFTEIVLALSGVEAIANMTGIMVQPVDKTSRKSIRPVIVEIVILNIILSIAMISLPDDVLYYVKGESVPASISLENVRLSDDGMPPRHTNDMLSVIATTYVGKTFSKFSSLVFALLLISAVNTAIADLVSIQFMLSRDRELPKLFSGLNKFGMPILPLAIASLVPAIVVLVFPNVTALAGLYAIGVVGAIGINLGTTSTNRKLPLRIYERRLMQLITLVMICIEATICQIKPEARGFALITLVLGLAARMISISLNRSVEIPMNRRTKYTAWAILAVISMILILGLKPSVAVFGRGSVSNFLDFIMAASVALALALISDRVQKREGIFTGFDEEHHEEHALGTAKRIRRKMLFAGSYNAKNRIMVATQGNPELMNYAIRECQAWEAELQLLYIRHVAVQALGPMIQISLNEDAAALKLFEQVKMDCESAGVPLRLLYGVSRDIPDAIVDFTVTHSADMLMLGVTRRGSMWTALKGDILMSIARNLPESVGLLIVGRTGGLRVAPPRGKSATFSSSTN